MSVLSFSPCLSASVQLYLSMSVLPFSPCLSASVQLYLCMSDATSICPYKVKFTLQAVCLIVLTSQKQKWLQEWLCREDLLDQYLCLNSRAQILHRNAIVHVSTIGRAQTVHRWCFSCWQSTNCTQMFQPVGRAQIVHRHAIAHVGAGIALWLERRTHN